MALLAYGFYRYRLSEVMTLNEPDKAFIESSFGKDSDGKGYSDAGHELMMMADGGGWVMWSSRTGG